MNINFVDLGLPSGTLWGDRNLGADTPEESGDYFRFGETVAFTEDSPEYVYDDITDSIAGTDRDAATVILGENYQTPTLEQIKELLGKCQWAWTKQNEVNGMKVTGPNGNSIFLPASGYHGGSSGSLYNVGSSGYYCSASPYSSYYGHDLYFCSGCWYWGNNPRAVGFPVRPVGTKFAK